MLPTRNHRTFRLLCACSLLLLSFGFIVPVSWAWQEPAKPAPAKTVTVGQGKSSRPGRSTAIDKNSARARNAQISKLVTEIDPRRIENSIRKLVSFGTRNTLSDQKDPNRGIGAARDWLYGEFMKAAQQSGGRMTVEKQTFEQPRAAAHPATHDAHQCCRDLERHTAGVSQPGLCGQWPLRFDVRQHYRCEVRRAGSQ